MRKINGQCEEEFFPPSFTHPFEGIRKPEDPRPDEGYEDVGYDLDGVPGGGDGGCPRHPVTWPPAPAPPLPNLGSVLLVPPWGDGGSWTPLRSLLAPGAWITAKCHKWCCGYPMFNL